MINAQNSRIHVSRSIWSPIWLIGPIFVMIVAGLGVASAYEPKLSLLITLALPVGLALLAWPEMTLALYDNAGLFKADPRLSSLENLGDITLGLAAALVATLVYRLILRRERFTWNREISLALIFAGVILSGLLYTPAGSYATDKAFRFVTLNLLAFFTPLVVMKSSRSVWLFLSSWLGIAALLTVDALSRLGTGERLSGFSGTGIAMSRTVGIAVIILLFAVLMDRVPRIWQLVAGASLGLMLFAMVGTGSRGPLLMLGISVLLTFGATLVGQGQWTRALFLMCILGLVILGVFSSGLIPSASLERFEILVNDTDTDTSSQARLEVMEVAWYLFTTSPVIGRGTGSVSAFGAGLEQVYPHNILLELAAETGLVGLGLYVAIVGRVLWRLLSSLRKKAVRIPLYLTLLAMILFTLLNAMVSGDLSANRDMWLIAGIAIAMTKISEEKTL